MKDELRLVSQDEYKAQIVNLLERIHNVCTENNIRYTIGFGTLIGAVRHKGFIPWDDDIDICMPREDYEKFAEKFQSLDGRYFVLDSTTKTYYNNMARACDGKITLKLKGVLKVPKIGAFIDVFFLDRWPESKAERQAYCEEIISMSHKVRHALPLSSYSTLTFKQRVKAAIRIFNRIYNRVFVGLEKRKEQRDKLLLRYADTDTGWRSVSFDNPNRTRWFIKEDDINKYILVEFEGLKVRAPENYHELLSDNYGDYMQLPPVEKRKTHHHFTPYWTD